MALVHGHGMAHGHGIVMKRVSGSTGFETSMIASLFLNGLKIEDIAPGSFYACQYENDWYLRNFFNGKSRSKH